MNSCDWKETPVPEYECLCINTNIYVPEEKIKYRIIQNGWKKKTIKKWLDQIVDRAKYGCVPAGECENTNMIWFLD